MHVCRGMTLSTLIRVFLIRAMEYTILITAIKYVFLIRAMKYVAYYRVSTKKQGESQLGLKAQEQAVKRYVAPSEIYDEFTEVETGTNKKQRPILKEAFSSAVKPRPGLGHDHVLKA